MTEESLLFCCFVPRLDLPGAPFCAPLTVLDATAPCLMFACSASLLKGVLKSWDLRASRFAIQPSHLPAFRYKAHLHKAHDRVMRLCHQVGFCRKQHPERLLREGMVQTDTTAMGGRGVLPCKAGHTVMAKGLLSLQEMGCFLPSAFFLSLLA